MQSLVDEEVALSADHLNGEIVNTAVGERISPVGTLDIGGVCCQWMGRVHHRQHSLLAPQEVEFHWTAPQKEEEERGGGRSEPDVELIPGSVRNLGTRPAARSIWQSTEDSNSLQLRFASLRPLNSPDGRGTCLTHPPLLCLRGWGNPF